MQVDEGFLKSNSNTPLIYIFLGRLYDHLVNRCRKKGVWTQANEGDFLRFFS